MKPVRAHPAAQTHAVDVSLPAAVWICSTHLLMLGALLRQGLSSLMSSISDAGRTKKRCFIYNAIPITVQIQIMLSLSYLALIAPSV
jgi:hypothetical protein